MLVSYQGGFVFDYINLVYLIFSYHINWELYYSYNMAWASLQFRVYSPAPRFSLSLRVCIREGAAVIVRHAWFVQRIDFMGFTCLIGIISTCAMNNLHTETVGYSLPGLLSPSGVCSCVGFLFYHFFPFLIIPLQNHGLFLTCEVKAPLLSVPSQRDWRTR